MVGVSASAAKSSCDAADLFNVFTKEGLTPKLLKFVLLFSVVVLILNSLTRYLGEHTRNY